MLSNRHRRARGLWGHTFITRSEKRFLQLLVLAKLVFSFCSGTNLQATQVFHRLLGSGVTDHWGLTLSPGKSMQRTPPGFAMGPKFLHVGNRCYKKVVKRNQLLLSYVQPVSPIADVS